MVARILRLVRGDIFRALVLEGLVWGGRYIVGAVGGYITVLSSSWSRMADG